MTKQAKTIITRVMMTASVVFMSLWSKIAQAQDQDPPKVWSWIPGSETINDGLEQGAAAKAAKQAAEDYVNYVENYSAQWQDLFLGRTDGGIYVTMLLWMAWILILGRLLVKINKNTGYVILVPLMAFSYGVSRAIGAFYDFLVGCPVMEISLSSGIFLFYAWACMAFALVVNYSAIKLLFEGLTSGEIRYVLSHGYMPSEYSERDDDDDYESDDTDDASDEDDDSEDEDDESKPKKKAKKDESDDTDDASDEDDDSEEKDEEPSGPTCAACGHPRSARATKRCQNCGCKFETPHSEGKTGSEKTGKRRERPKGNPLGRV